MIKDKKEPFEIFAKWLKEAESDARIIEPTAMNLATVNAENKPSSRMVLLKKFDESGFCFFTNFTSRKAKELEANKNVALCFYWGALGRQVRIEGEVEEVSAAEADDYFSSRRRGSQIGAWASKQSQEMANDEEFLKRIKQTEEDFAGTEVKRPPFWSGFRVKPQIIEFWEEAEFRLHKRTIYKKSANGWQTATLYP
ncbi:MAG: pdxH [Rickettsiaceae bacterium]|jgi:pyridoxamine 5'-phosphate oxidase|nr:pdxH [Rickettsiaceae bacterium]